MSLADLYYKLPVASLDAAMRPTRTAAIPSGMSVRSVQPAPVRLWAARSFGSLVTCVGFILALSYYFYAYIHDVWHQPYILSGLLLSLTTDALLLFLNITQPRIRHEQLHCDPRKLSIVLICHNSAAVLDETLRQALRHVPPPQVLVVSDASTDDTEKRAAAYGVRVFVNRRNLNKGLSINQIIHEVTTPYVLILDDDTRIGALTIPTNLLDEGWSAVAFRVLPEPRPGWVNQFQQFEYAKTMMLGKSSRTAIGAVSNVSGAIGLYRTDCLREQSGQHTGQSGGEDQQRTLFTHLQSYGRGVTYVDQTAYTVVPVSWRALARQRAFKWSRSTQENFWLCWYILANPDTPALLKLERMLQLFIVLTDPLRILLGWLIITRPRQLLAIYCFYLLLAVIAWRTTKEKVSPVVILLSPVYGFFKCLCRFCAHFHWFKVKYDYLIKRRYHHLVTDRNIVIEYASTAAIIGVMWVLAVGRLMAVVRGMI